MCCSVCVVLCCRIAVVALMYGFECMCVDLTYVAVRCSVLQYVAVCVLQCAAVCSYVIQCGCSVLRCVPPTRSTDTLRQHSRYKAVCCSVLQSIAVCCSVLQCVAVCCSVLQCVAVCCSVLRCVSPTRFIGMLRQHSR